MNTADCRGGGDSYHVGYAVDDEGFETENITHAVAAPDFEERDDAEVGWVAQLFEDSTTVQVLVTDDFDMGGFAVDHKISVTTAEQLSDMFAKIALMARERIEMNRLDRELAEREAAEIRARQGDLFKEQS